MFILYAGEGGGQWSLGGAEVNRPAQWEDE